MKRKMHKTLSLLLAAAMAFGVAAMPVAADDPSVPETPITGNLEDGMQDSEEGENKTPEPSAEPTPAPSAEPAASAEPTPAPSAEPTASAEPTPDPSAEPTASAEPVTRSLSDEELADLMSQIFGSVGSDLVDPSKIEIGEIEPNRPNVTEEEIQAAKESDDPILAQFREALEDAELKGEEEESAESGISLFSAESVDEEETETPVVDPEDVETTVAQFNKFLQYWYENEDVLGVQLPFYLKYNDSGKDSLGILGQMLVLAGHDVDEVRNGEYSLDDVNGMILNFMLGDQLGVEYYGVAVENQRNAALKFVEESGAKTEAQKLLALNTWLAQENTFDMSYIMNQMDPENPVMAAEEPQQHEHYDEIYAAVEAIYRPQITEQFTAMVKTQVTAQVQTMYAISFAESLVFAQANPTATQDEIAAHVQEFLESNKEEIQEDPDFLTNHYAEEIVQEAQAAAESYITTEEGQAAIADAMETAMNTQVPDLGNMTPNQAIEVYVQQAAEGLTTGIIGYWQGNHIGALASGASVCMGYAKAMAYLIQAMHPEIYGVNGENSDMSDPAQWKTPDEVYEFDDNGNVIVDESNYIVDMVRITFQASVSMYGVPQPEFGSDHFWNAVRLDGKWYYIDPCYTDVWSEVMIRDRVEVDGFMNHTYFLVSDTSLRNMFSGNFDEDDPEKGIQTLYQDLAVYKDYEDSWISRIASNVTSDDEGYFYYTYDSTDLISMLEQYQESEGDYSGLMELGAADYKIVRHKLTDTDAGSDGDTDYETLIDFTHKDSEDDDESYVAVWRDDELVKDEMLTALYDQFLDDQEVYPSIDITPVYYNGKVYFNLSNCILSYDVDSGEVVKVKEYNTVYAKRDKTVAFGGMAFDVVDSAEEADFTFQNHPIAGIALKDDGQLYVTVATNLSYIAGKADQHDYASEGFGYVYEETNYNSDYNSYANAEAENSGMDDDMLEQMGYKTQTNDNEEFMWVANAVETMDMAHFAGNTHNYAEVEVAASCGRNAFTEDRCTECGAIENGSRMEEADTATAHHFVFFKEQYNTSDSKIAPNGEDPKEGEVAAEDAVWNEGSSYVCTVCGAAVSTEEPEEPKEDDIIYSGGYMDFDAAYAKYVRDHALWEEAEAAHDEHEYVPTDAEWSDDGDGTGKVTFQKLTCAICGDAKLDCLYGNTDINVTLSAPQTVDCTVKIIESTCEGNTKVYTLTDYTFRDNGKEYKVSATYEEKTDDGAGHQAAGYQHDADKHWKVCTVCGEIFDQAAHTGIPCSVCGYGATGGNTGNQGGTPVVDEHPDIAEGIANGTWGGSKTTTASGSANADAAAQQTNTIPKTADEMPMQAVTIVAVLSGLAAAALVVLRKRSTDR